ncbi:MAG: S-layer homology domain-containing protein, partial [Oscillospiraceae bacterium]|nr:S-layer homology domain-containing protein [Oscillospiraceae bacterium]
VDKDGLGGDAIPKYAYTDSTNRLMVMASEQLEGKGLIIVSGAAFMSNFEVQATVDNGAEKNYSNYRICENLVKYLNPVTTTDIVTVRAQTEAGYKYTIEGVVTSNASGYDKETAFFDCIYIQDATGGICCFPVSGEYKIGDKVRVTGTTDFYQGEPELQVTSIEVIGKGTVAPTEITAAELNDRSAEGKLVTVKGTVESFELANGLVQTIMVKDAAGNVARVFIDGYITTSEDVKDLKVGCKITATGLASYDDTFNAPEGPFPRIRVRDRADIVCTKSTTYVPVTPVTPVKPTNNFPFEDVSESDYYYDAVKYAWENGLFTGVTDTEFAPGTAMNRGMLATVLYRMANEPDGTFSFDDVFAGDWYFEGVSWAASVGIINGYGDGTFGPKDLVTREQAVAMLYRYCQSMGLDVSARADLSAYPDAETISAYAVEPMQWAVAVGLINGRDTGEIDPTGTATRVELALILMRFCEQVVKK